MKKKIIRMISDEDMKLILSGLDAALSHQVHLTNDPHLTKEERIKVHGLKNQYLEILVKLGGKHDMQSNRDLRETIHAVSGDIVIIDTSGIIYGAKRETEQGVSRSRADHHRNSKVSMRTNKCKSIIRSSNKHQVHSKNSKRSPKKIR